MLLPPIPAFVLDAEGDADASAHAVGRQCIATRVHSSRLRSFTTKSLRPGRKGLCRRVDMLASLDGNCLLEGIVSRSRPGMQYRCLHLPRQGRDHTMTRLSLSQIKYAQMGGLERGRKPLLGPFRERRETPPIFSLKLIG